MLKHYTSKSGLFLIELILSIFFFIAASAVILQLFVKSHFLSESTVNINHALNYTQNISEIFLSSNGNFETVKTFYTSDNISISDDTLFLLFDNNWNNTNSTTDSKYSILVDYRTDDTFAYIDIYINIYTPELTDFIQDGKHRSYLLQNGYIHHQHIKKYIN